MAALLNQSPLIRFIRYLQCHVSLPRSPEQIEVEQEGFPLSCERIDFFEIEHVKTIVNFAWKGDPMQNWIFVKGNCQDQLTIQGRDWTGKLNPSGELIIKAWSDRKKKLNSI